jgi:hypothetical protein
MGRDGLPESLLPDWGWIPELGLEDATAVPSGGVGSSPVTQDHSVPRIGMYRA